LAAVEHLHREYDKEDVQRADNHPLGAEKGDQQAGRGLANEQPKAREGSVQAAGAAVDGERPHPANGSG
jgi:hypothetical protein